MGLGLLGRGVGDADFLAACGAEVTVTDLKDARTLAPSVARLAHHPNITWVLGRHRTEDFCRADMVLKAAGVPHDSPFVRAAHERGVSVEMSAALLVAEARHLNPHVRVVGVTGTRGKTTTTMLLSHTLRHAGVPALVGGNVRGVANLPLLKKVHNAAVLVLELDSWQLQGFGTRRIAPDIAVFTTFMDDHLNYYRGDRRAYFADKAHIFLHQKKGDVLIMGAQAYAAVRPWLSPADCARAQKVSGEALPPEWRLPLLGAHNRANAACARAALTALGVEDTAIREGFASFPGVEGRLEDMGVRAGVRWINDNNATTPDATIAALRALPEYAGRVILIAGGADKGLAQDALAREIAARCKAVVLLSGSGTPALRAALADAEYPRAALSEYGTLAACVQAAHAAAQRGDAVLFSPAFASFSKEFQNEYERNDAFRALWASLT